MTDHGAPGPPAGNSTPSSIGSGRPRIGNPSRRAEEALRQFWRGLVHWLKAATGTTSLPEQRTWMMSARSPGATTSDTHRHTLPTLRYVRAELRSGAAFRW